jgi:fatty-acyl-CoA synthase
MNIELENLISMHKAVAESAVVGVPDEKWGERPVAYVVLKEAYKDQITGDDLKSHLKNMIEKWAIPDRYIFTEEIPKTSVGKINKKLIRAKYQA